MKKIAVGDLGEFWYGDYKEPFEQLEGAVPGHPVGVVLKTDDGRLLCAYCGKTFDDLGRHVFAKHHMTAREYKAEVGLLQKSALVSEVGRTRRIATGKRLGTPAHVAKMVAARNPSSSRPDIRGRRNPMWTPEALNKTGRCYEQTLAVARSILAEGGRITQKSMGKRGIGHLTLVAYFGEDNPYAVLRRLVGDPNPVIKRRWTNEALLVAYRSLAEKLGRTPTQSDLNRYGLPAANYQRKFGGLEEAARRCGLPGNLPVPHDKDWTVRVLTAYAVLGRTDRTAEHIGTTHKSVAGVFARFGCPIPLQAKGDARRLRREWAAMMARRLAGMPDEVAA